MTRLPNAITTVIITRMGTSAAIITRRAMSADTTTVKAMTALTGRAAKAAAAITGADRYSHGSP